MLSDLSVYLIQFVFILTQVFFPKEAALVEDIVSEIQVEQNVLGTFNESSYNSNIEFSQEWAQDKESAVVSRVVDGDTVELLDGRKVRYLAIDTPESVDPRKTVECFGKEASKANEILVLGKEVWLEQDITDSDRYSRLLRYVYTVDPESNKIIFINEVLVSEGFAHAYLYKPDIKHYDYLKEAEDIASLEQKGFWASGVCEE